MTSKWFGCRTWLLGLPFLKTAKLRHRAWERGGKNSCSEGLEGAAARAFEPFDKVITKREDLTFFRPFIGLFKKPF
jgi:hypothetical protein